MLHLCVCSLASVSFFALFFQHCIRYLIDYKILDVIRICSYQGTDDGVITKLVIPIEE